MIALPRSFTRRPHVGAGCAASLRGPADSQILNNGIGVLSRGNAAGITTTVTISNSTLSGNGVGLVACAGTATAVTRAHLSRSTITNGGEGAFASNQYLSVEGSQIVDNGATGLANQGSGLVETIGNNIVRGNLDEYIRHDHRRFRDPITSRRAPMGVQGDRVR